MKHAIAILRIHAENAARNAPIHAAEGNYEQSALDLAVREECLNAIEVLEHIAAEPEVPQHPQAVS